MHKILIVDDEKSERDGIRYLIKKYGFPFTVAEASNGKKALEYIQDNHIDILYTDIKMPYMDGLELAKEVYKLFPKIKIVIFSAHGEFEYAKSAMEAKAIDYLLKPIELDEFHKVMTNVIEQCNDKVKESNEKKKRQEQEHQWWLFQLLSSNNFTKGEEQLNEENKRLASKWTTLLLIETNQAIFPRRNKEILQIIDTYVSIEYTYVHINSYSAYVVLHNNKKLPQDELLRLSQKLCQDIHLLLNESAFIIISENIRDVRGLREEAVIINKWKENILWNERVLFSAQLKLTSNNYHLTLDEKRNYVLVALDKGDIQEVKDSIHILMSDLQRLPSISASYVHHLFYSLVDKLYKNHGIHDQSFVMLHLEELIKCKTINDLKIRMESMMEEIQENEAIKIDEVNVTDRVMKIIKAEYNKEIGLDYIAEKVFLSPAYLSYFFKQETGETIIKRLSEYRMNKAKELLRTSNMKVIQIAKLCGFQNHSYFARLFKKTQGVTPTQYRERKYVNERD